MPSYFRVGCVLLPSGSKRTRELRALDPNTQVFTFRDMPKYTEVITPLVNEKGFAVYSTPEEGQDPELPDFVADILELSGVRNVCLLFPNELRVDKEEDYEWPSLQNPIISVMEEYFAKNDALLLDDRGDDTMTLL